MTKFAVYCLLIFSLSISSIGQTNVPQFRDYKVETVYKGNNAPVIIGKEDRMFRTRLRAAAKQKPNFAGHYVLTAWGCGTTCLMGAVIDVKSGKVYWWDFSICCWGKVDEGFNPIEIRQNSKLVIFSGNRNEKEDDYGSHFYKFENGKFTFIETVERDDGIEDVWNR